MKTVASSTLNLAAAVLIVFASATVAAAAVGTDTCAGEGATIGGTCTPLTNTTSGDNDNTATGFDALFNNAGGSSNVATGEDALLNNTIGGDNTATGVGALQDNTIGGNNTAAGVLALFHNTTGSFNTATGEVALESNTTGSSNIGIGAGAGGNLTTGDNNIDIFDAGVAAEANTIRIGTQGTQTATFIAGIFGTPKIKKACQVVVETTGLLGCVKSSARYKRDIRDMGDASDKLMRLRPVTFRYKADSTGIEQYGLIAEEVEKVYPELVIDGADGKAETVAYQVLPAMLLNEVQKQSRQLARKDVQIASMQKQLDALRKKDDQIDALSERINALEQQARKATREHLASAMR